MILVMELSWSNKEIDFYELLKIYFSISDKFYLHEIYTVFVDKKHAPLYQIKALCCLIGAHYYCFIRNDEKDGNKPGSWTLYNDEVIEHMKSWFQVLKNMIDIKVFPTLLIYE